MARISYAERALGDLERLTDFLSEADPAQALETVDLIAAAIDILADHPLIGRPFGHGHRELMISRGRTGYVALYRFVAEEDAVLILSVRHQREAGYPDEFPEHRRGQ